MIKKASFVGIVLVLVIMISGCTSSGVQKESTDRDYHKGTDGVTMEFVKNAPPDKLYTGDPFEMIIELKNEGAYPESETFEGKLRISGVDGNAIRGTWEDGNEIEADFVGKSQYLPDGGYTTMTYIDRDGVNIPFDADILEQTVLVHLCYKYKTIATAEVCLDPDPYAVVQEDKVCEFGDTTLSGGQGGPVSVTKVEQEIGKDKTYFRIYIKNVGDGSVIKRSEYNSCPFDLELSDIDKVFVTVDLPHDGSPKCTPSGTSSDPVRLVDGQGSLLCSFDNPTTDSAFVSPLKITLDYAYSTSISKDIEIVNIE